MKILRKHSGFTTNSSSSSEWVTPGMSATTLPESAFDAQGNLIDTNVPSAMTNSASSISNSVPAAASETAPNNALMLGSLICAVVGIFALERFLRRLLKKPARPEDH